MIGRKRSKPRTDGLVGAPKTLMARVLRSQKGPRQRLAQSPEGPLMPLSELASSVEEVAYRAQRFAPCLGSTCRPRPTVQGVLSISALPLRLIKSPWPLHEDVPVMPHQQTLVESGDQHFRSARQGQSERGAACEHFHTCYAIILSKVQR